MIDASAKLQAWIMDNWVTGSIYQAGGRHAGWKQAFFMRDVMPNLGTTVSVIGQHRSKSIELPVYHVVSNERGWEFVARENFHGWVVSVKTEGPWASVWSPRRIPGFHMDDHDYMKEDTPARRDEWPVGMFAPCYAEGFPVEWCFGRHTVNALEYTVRFQNEHDLYMLAALPSL